KVSAEVDLVHQQTQNQRYGSSHIGATAKDISNGVTDAASGVVDICRGIDKAVADTWNSFWRGGKADGSGYSSSKKYVVGSMVRRRTRREQCADHSRAGGWGDAVRRERGRIAAHRSGGAVGCDRDCRCAG